MATQQFVLTCGGLLQDPILVRWENDLGVVDAATGTLIGYGFDKVGVEVAGMDLPFYDVAEELPPEVRAEATWKEMPERLLEAIGRGVGADDEARPASEATTVRREEMVVVSASRLPASDKSLLRDVAGSNADAEVFEGQSGLIVWADEDHFLALNGRELSGEVQAILSRAKREGARWVRFDERL